MDCLSLITLTFEKARSSATKRDQRYATDARSVLQNLSRFSLQGGASGSAAKRSHGLATYGEHVYMHAAGRQAFSTAGQ
jgi:hypothetical protein